jgi:glycosyltransferase involved in cell wall biosynthesis
MKLPASRREVRSILNEFKPNVIILRTFHDLVLFRVFFGSVLLGQNLVFDAASEIISERKIRKLIPTKFIKYLNSGVKLHIAASKKVAGGIQCLGAQRIMLHYSGATVNLESKQLLPTIQGIRFLVVGRLIDLKRPLWILRNVLTVAEDMRKSNSKLTLIGDGDLLCAVKKFVEQNNMFDIVEVIGSVSIVDGYYVNSDVLLIGSTFEGLPLTIYEAKQFGLRVLTTPSGGSHEVLGPEDRVCSDFSEGEFCKQLIQQIRIGKTTISDRQYRMKIYRKFSLDAKVQYYYQELKDLFT